MGHCDMSTVSISDDHRFIIVVEWSKRDTANDFASAWDPNPDGEDTFGHVELSSDGTAPPTHTACNTLATDGMRTEILEAMNNVPFVDVYDVWDGWSFDDVLADLGLRPINSQR